MGVASISSLKHLLDPILPNSQIPAPLNPLFSIARASIGPLQRRLLTVSVRAQDSVRQPSQQQRNFSVLRFTLGTSIFSYLFSMFYFFFVCRFGCNLTVTNQINHIHIFFKLRCVGIPGLDESYLPRWIGVGFGLLDFLNHLLSADRTPAQIVCFTKPLCKSSYFYFVFL
jgi:hypothetical protein